MSFGGLKKSIRLMLLLAVLLLAGCSKEQQKDETYQEDAGGIVKI